MSERRDVPRSATIFWDSLAKPTNNNDRVVLKNKSRLLYMLGKQTHENESSEQKVQHRFCLTRLCSGLTEVSPPSCLQHCSISQSPGPSELIATLRLVVVVDDDPACDIRHRLALLWCLVDALLALSEAHSLVSWVFCTCVGLTCL